MILMYTIVKKEILNPTVVRMVIDAPAVAKKAQPGQFIILHVAKRLSMPSKKALSSKLFATPSKFSATTIPTIAVTPKTSAFAA